MQVLDQANLIEQGSVSVEVDEEVDVAALPSFASGDRAEYTHPRGAPPPRR
jgi:hypothetical protein